MKRKLLVRSILGAPIGVTISLTITIIFSICLGNGEFFPAPHELIDWCGGSETKAVIIQMICSLLVGAVCGGSSIIWDIEKWSLLKQTIIHFMVIVIPFFGVGYIMNWMPHYLYGALGYIGGFIVVYIIMWFSLYFSIKEKIKKMNKQLQGMQQKKEN